MFRLFSITTAIRVLGAVAQLILTLSVTRLAGAAEAGLFFFGYSIVLILSAVSRLGAELSGLRAVAAIRASGRRRDMESAVIARLVLTAGCSALLAIGYAVLAAPVAQAQFGGDHALRAMLLLAAALPAMALVGLISEFLKAADMASLGICLQNIAVPGLASLGVLLTAIFHKPDAQAIAGAVLAAACISAALSAFAWFAWLRTWKPRKDADAPNPDEAGVAGEIVGILRDAPALLVVSTTSIVMQWIGAVILGLMAAPEDVAGYSVAVRLAIAVSIVHSAASSVIAPRMAAAQAAGDLTRLRLLSHQTALLIFGTTLPVLVALFTLAGFWLSFFGAGFGDFSQTLRMLIAGQLVAAAIGHSGTILVMCGRFGSARWTSVIAAGALAALMLALVPAFGALGAAAAMSGGVIAGHLAGLFLVKREIGFWSLPLSRADFGAIRQSVAV